MDLIPSVLSDLLAGLAASGIVASAALVARRVAWGTARRFATFLGWPSVAAVFFAVSLLSAILRGGTEAVVVLGVLLALTASVMLLRFGPARLHLSLPDLIQPPVRFVRTYPWRTLTAIFLLTTVALLVMNVQGNGHDDRDRLVFVVDLDDWEMLGIREVLDELEGELGAEVLLWPVKSGRHVARLDNMLASGDMKWDLIATDNNMAGVLGTKGLVQDLSEYAEYDDIIPQSLLPALRPLIKYEDRFYFAPFRPNVKIAFYNEKKFALYGLEPPQDWDQLLEVARVFKTREGVGCVAIQGEPGKATAVTVFEKDAPHPERAVKLIELLLSQETQEKLVDYLGWPPVRLDVTIPPEMVGYFDAVQEDLSFAETRPNVPQWALAEECLDDAFRGLIVERNGIETLPKYSECLERIPDQWDPYEVKPGETLSIIARRYDVTPDMLATVNGITTRTHVVGQVLLVPHQ